jgi:hypothetical protein
MYNRWEGASAHKQLKSASRQVVCPTSLCFLILLVLLLHRWCLSSSKLHGALQCSKWEVGGKQCPSFGIQVLGSPACLANWLPNGFSCKHKQFSISNSTLQALS